MVSSLQPPDAEAFHSPAEKAVPPRFAAVAKNNREQGQSTVEFVLVLPLLLMFFFLMVDFGWLLKNWIVVTNSAREATRCAVAQSCSLNGTPVTPSALASSRIQDGITTNLDPPQIVVSYYDEDNNSRITAGDSIIICIKANNKYISPIFPFLSFVTRSNTIPSGGLPLEAREQMRLELDPPPGGTVNPDGKCHF